MPKKSVTNKEKPIEYLGYLGNLSPTQEECFNKFKEWITVNDITHNPWHDDCFFLKFCRARKFEIEKVIEMFNNYI